MNQKQLKGMIIGFGIVAVIGAGLICYCSYQLGIQYGRESCPVVDTVEIPVVITKSGTQKRIIYAHQYGGNTVGSRPLGYSPDKDTIITIKHY